MKNAYLVTESRRGTEITSRAKRSPVAVYTDRDEAKQVAATFDYSNIGGSGRGIVTELPLDPEDPS